MTVKYIRNFQNTCSPGIKEDFASWWVQMYSVIIFFLVIKVVYTDQHIIGLTIRTNRFKHLNSQVTIIWKPAYYIVSCHATTLYSIFP